MCRFRIAVWHGVFIYGCGKTGSWKEKCICDGMIDYFGLYNIPFSVFNRKNKIFLEIVGQGYAMRTSQEIRFMIMKSHFGGGNG
jgi:hypothetical protein